MATFLEKNKKKSLAALVLLFFRERRLVSAVLLVVVCASFLFVSPSNLILRFPGGPRVAASVAWLASELGFDTDQWGLPEGRRGFSDLVAAFRAAKEGGGKAGWGAFMRGTDGRGSAGDLGSGSLGFVKGDRRDLEAGGGKAGQGGDPAIAGILSADEAAKVGDGDAVALSGKDLKGERAGWLSRIFGFGLSEGGIKDANGAVLSGGPYAALGFFRGSSAAGSGKTGGGSGAGAVGSSLKDQVDAGLSGVGGAATPKGVLVQKGAKGRLSYSQANAIEARTTKGIRTSRALARDRAYAQLAVGHSLAKVAVAPDCSMGNGCPGEFGSTNTGAVYDGNSITGKGTDILTAPAIDGDGTPRVPDTGTVDGYIGDAEKMKECADKINLCEAGKQPDYKRLGQMQTHINNLYGQLPGACGDPCECDPCINVQNQIKAACGGELQSVIDRIDKPCDLPSYCAGLGVSSPAGSATGPMKQMCGQMQTGSCGSGGILEDILCGLGS